MIIFDPHEFIVVLTGAGISAESGIRTFRDNNGLWEEYPVEEVATPQAFERNPKLVWRFYNERRKQLQSARPNRAHFALAEIEEKMGENFLLITQNVDDLHERAGSKNILHIHGELKKVRCTKCDYLEKREDNLSELPICPKCFSLLRPHIVWFGETPFYLDVIYRVLKRCDWFIAIGTSGVVYPAAQFVQEAKASDARTICINPDPDASSQFFDYHFKEKAGDALTLYASQWIKDVE